MLRGLRLPGKMVFAAVPLILALTATAALLVRSSFLEADRQRDTAILAGSLDDLSQVLGAIRAEAGPFTDATEGVSSDPALQTATDETIASYRRELERVDTRPLLAQLDRAVTRLAELRTGIEEGRYATVEVITPSEGTPSPIPSAYEDISTEFLKITSLMPVEAASLEARRELEALAAISRARLAAAVQDRVILEEIRETVSLTASIDKVQDINGEIDGWLAVFETVADTKVKEHYARSGVPEAIQTAEDQIQVLLDSPLDGFRIPQSEWAAVLDARWDALVAFETDWIEAIVEDGAAEATRATQNAWVVAGAALGSMLLAAVATALVSRSIVRRVRTVTDRARQVSHEQLPALVEALRDPSADAQLPSMPPIRDRGADEVGDLARSFAAMQSTLEDVARQQLDTLRKGVADMFVTLARRNRSLIDRQLALIDQLEAHEDDPEALSDFYRLDHLATRMRRNAESLLVLAGSETPRAWQRPLDIDDVVRAAVGEVEDYRRVDILALEGLRIRGGAVADVSHLLSELLENAAAFSPPESRVRVAGHFHDNGYLITVSDRGVGLGESRIAEVNRLLDSPPVVGLALEPTLGLYVVAMLAKRHGIRVRLVGGAPGVTAQVLLPKALFEVEPAAIDGGEPGPQRGRRSDAPGSHAALGEAGVPGDASDAGRTGATGKHSPSPEQQPTTTAVPASGDGAPSTTPSPRPPAGPPHPIAPEPARQGVSPERVTDLPARQPVRAVHPTQGPGPGSSNVPAGPTEPKSPARPTESPKPPSVNGLPARVPGASFTDTTPERPVAPSPDSAAGLKNALSSFQAGQSRAGEHTSVMSLPTRVPGASFPDDTPPGDPITNQSVRNPDSIRSALGAFQTGMETGRRHAQDEEEKT